MNRTLETNVLTIETDAERTFSRAYKKVKIEQFPTEELDFSLSVTKVLSSASNLQPSCHSIFKTNCRCRRAAQRNDNAYLRLDLVFENYMHDMSRNYKYRIKCNWLHDTGAAGTSKQEQLCSFEEVRTSKYMTVLIDTHHNVKCIIDDLEKAVISVSIERFCISPSQTNTLPSDFLTLFNNPMYSDAKLKIGKSIFRVHKNILSCRSPVFNAMFNCDMSESNTGIVVVKDVPADAMRELLRYIYGGTAENLGTMTTEIFKAAIKYQVDGLKNDCIEYLIFNVNLENMHSFYNLLNLYDMTELRDKVSTFIKNNKRIPMKDKCL